MNTQVLSGASSVSFGSTYLSSTYSHYELILSHVTVNTTSTWLEFQIGTGGGPTYQTTSYAWMASLLINGGQAVANSNSGTYIPVSWNGAGANALDTAAGNTLSSHIRIDSPTTSTVYTMISIETSYVSKSAGPAIFTSSGYFPTAAVTTAVRIIPSSGTFTGRATLYGYANA